jgi:hypothetical protein
MVQSQQLRLSEKGQVQQIKVEKLPPGTYIFYLVNKANNKSFTRKLLVQ